MTFEIGESVIYIPGHARGDASHPDCEHGIVTSCGEKMVFVRFTPGAGSMACTPTDLVKSR